MVQSQWLSMVVFFARSGLYKVKSIVAFRLSVWDGFVPRFFGVARTNLFSFCRYFLTFIPEALVGYPLSHNSE
jgi:hypothetical protein